MVVRLCGDQPTYVFVFARQSWRVFFKGKLLQPVVTFKVKTNKTPETLKGNVETPQKLFGRAHAINSSVGEESPFCAWQPRET